MDLNLISALDTEFKKLPNDVVMARQNELDAAYNTIYPWTSLDKSIQMQIRFKIYLQFIVGKITLATAIREYRTALINVGILEDETSTVTAAQPEREAVYAISEAEVSAPILDSQSLAVVPDAPMTIQSDMVPEPDPVPQEDIRVADAVLTLAEKPEPTTEKAMLSGEASNVNDASKMKPEQVPESKKPESETEQTKETATNETKLERKPEENTTSPTLPSQIKPVVFQELVSEVQTNQTTEASETQSEAVNKDTNPERVLDTEDASQMQPSPPPPPTKPAWLELEPEDQTDARPHTAYECIRLNEQWTLLAGSVRGKLHAHNAIWRDDAYAYGQVDDWTILAVSDGAGSAHLSRVGAQIACEESVKTLKGLLNGFKLPLGLPENGNSDLLRLQSFLAEGARKALYAIQNEAQHRQCSTRDLHATLLLLIHCPTPEGKELLGAIQVGDGIMAFLTEDEQCKLIGVADHGEQASQTRFLTTPGVEREFDGRRVRFSIQERLRTMALMTDGVSDDLFPEQERMIELFLGNPIQELKTREGGPLLGVMLDVVRNPREGQALLDWLRYEKRASSDDRTLLVMVRSDLA